MAKSDETLIELETAINNHFRAVWEEAGQTGETDYIPDWVVVIAYQDLAEGFRQAGYSVETRKEMHAHQIKGLLSEGIDWVEFEQHGGDDE